MKLWFVEIAVRDPVLAEGWYTRFLRRGPSLRDPATGFVFYELDSGRVALRPGKTVDEISSAMPGSVLIHLLCDDLDVETRRLLAAGIAPVEGVKVGESEGYRRGIYADPEGNRWVLFEWTEKGKGADRP